GRGPALARQEGAWVKSGRALAGQEGAWAKSGRALAGQEGAWAKSRAALAGQEGAWAKSRAPLRASATLRRVGTNTKDRPPRGSRPFTLSPGRPVHARSSWLPRSAQGHLIDCPRSGGPLGGGRTPRDLPAGRGRLVPPP